MLFNSYVFIFAFLPLTLLGFLLLRRAGAEAGSRLWLVAASLFFYGWWNPAYLPLIVGSLVVNFLLGTRLALPGRRRGALLALGVAVNLGLLGYFKYAGFFTETLRQLGVEGVPDIDVVLPLAISFFTFQQIAYLVDAYRGETREYDFLNYALFVTFFPQLIAGPIVHHREMMPQFRRSLARLRHSHLAVGTSIFAIGLFKKVIIADGLSEFTGPVFDAAADGTILTAPEAWFGVLAYTFQLYFDFSGYSDMAVGLARLFGIRLPVNFHSPYKAANIIDFWRRWHITLSRFLRDYLYIPLGGNRRGGARRYANLMVTMLLGGLWHGAGWTFVVWGGLHGLYLSLNHGWRHLLGARLDALAGQRSYRFAAGALTFFAVTIAWVFFRAADFDAATSLLRSMFGLHGQFDPGAGGFWEAAFPHGIFHRPQGVVNWFLIVGVITWFAPNTHQLLCKYRPVVGLPADWRCAGLRWRPTWRWALAIALLLLSAILQMNTVSEFLYFQF